MNGPVHRVVIRLDDDRCSDDGRARLDLLLTALIKVIRDHSDVKVERFDVDEWCAEVLVGGKVAVRRDLDGAVHVDVKPERTRGRRLRVASA